MSRVRDSRDAPAAQRVRGAYRDLVSDSASRPQAFAAFVRSALAEARRRRGWTGVRVAEETGLSRQTINRWIRGEWTTDPEPKRVVGFCDALGISPTVAFGILGWGRSARKIPDVTPAGTDGTGAGTPPMDPDVEALLRRLLDPRVSDAEKFHIRETIRYLAYRPALPGAPARTRDQAG